MNRAASIPPPLPEALLEAVALLHPATAVRLVETHLAWVLLAGDFAYKVKKPVRLPFVDFSTPAAREAACREELRINRRTAPDLYLDVVPLAGEWAVRMRRFADDALLSLRARAGRLEGASVDALAEAVAALHRLAQVAPPDSGYGTPAAVRRPAELDFAEIAAVAPRVAAAQPFRSLREWTLGVGTALEPVFERRRAEGFVREGHGDLHLANLAWIDGAPRLFDALEFDPGLRWIDVMSDVAFLFMDLVRHGLEPLAWRFLDGYLQRTGDYGGLAVLRYYAVYRAMVRAKVACLRLAQEPGEAERRALEAELDALLRTANRLARREAPLLLLMHGPSGSGKTTASQHLLESLGAVRLRSDVERKRGARADGDLYGEARTNETYALLAREARECMAAGYPVVVDATCLQRDRRDQLRQAADEAQAEWRIVSCRAEDDELRRRVGARRAAGRDASDADLAVLDRQLTRADPLDPEERGHATLLDTGPDGPWRRQVEALAGRLRSAPELP